MNIYDICLERFLEKGTKFWPLPIYITSTLLQSSALHAENRKQTKQSSMKLE
jgi:hypothetical protein